VRQAPSPPDSSEIRPRPDQLGSWAGTTAQATFPPEALWWCQSHAALMAPTRHRPRPLSSSAAASTGTGGCGSPSWTSISTRARSDASRSRTSRWAAVAWHAWIALVTSSETTSSVGSLSAPRSPFASTRRAWCRAEGTALGSAGSSRWLCSGQAFCLGGCRPSPAVPPLAGRCGSAGGCARSPDAPAHGRGISPVMPAAMAAGRARWPIVLTTLPVTVPPVAMVQRPTMDDEAMCVKLLDQFASTRFEARPGNPGRAN
jgi:hypothetical protein